MPGIVACIVCWIATPGLGWLFVIDAVLNSGTAGNRPASSGSACDAEGLWVGLAALPLGLPKSRLVAKRAARALVLTPGRHRCFLRARGKTQNDPKDLT